MKSFRAYDYSLKSDPGFVRVCKDESEIEVCQLDNVPTREEVHVWQLYNTQTQQDASYGDSDLLNPRNYIKASHRID